MLGFLILLLIVLGTYFWFESMKTKEIALAAAKQYCKEKALQLLDDTVACKRVRLRNRKGRFYFERLYQATTYDRDQDKKSILPIILYNRVIQRVGSVDKSVVSLSDYRE